MPYMLHLYCIYRLFLKEIELPQRSAKILRCNNCAYQWTYCGKSPFFTSCPQCHGSVATKNKPEKSARVSASVTKKEQDKI
jgi:hypothetical protein